MDLTGSSGLVYSTGRTTSSASYVYNRPRVRRKPSFPPTYASDLDNTPDSDPVYVELDIGFDKSERTFNRVQEVCSLRGFLAF